MQYIQLQSQLPQDIATPGAGSLNFFVDSTTNAIKLKDSNGAELSGNGGISVNSVTYSQLVSMIGSGSLSQGSYYIITDFQSCYDQPDYDYNGNSINTGNYKTAPVEPIMVLAVSSSLISDQAYSLVYPNDSIKYDWTWNTTEITNGPALGRITERIDDQNNRTDFDHRNITFKRYKTYFINNELSGNVYSFNYPTVTGDNTNFSSSLTVGDVVYIATPNQPNFYKVTQIDSDTSIQVEGNTNSGYNDGLKYPIKIYSTNVQSSPGGLYLFNDVGNSNYIDDGGNDMYDGGNYLNTNLYSTIPYTHTQMTNPPINSNSQATELDFAMDGAVQSGDSYFGASSNYFTNLYPGLFVMQAENVAVSTFTISGELGADEDGNQTVYDYTINYSGSNYAVYTKRISGAQDPSVNHIIIVDTNGAGITHTIGTTTDDDQDQISGIDNATKIHYLLIALSEGAQMSISKLQQTVIQYLALVHGNDINTSLSNLNSGYQNITSIFPPRYLSLEWKQNNIQNDTGSVDYTIFDSVEAKGIYFGDVARYYQDYELGFILPNNVFLNSQYVETSKFGDLCLNNSFYGQVYDNEVQNLFQKNVFYGEFYRNKIDVQCHDNVVYNRFYDNTIGKDFYYNTFFTPNLNSDNVNRNYINNEFRNNTIFTNQFQNNVIGNAFNNNKLYYIDFYGNSIGVGYNNNRIVSQFYHNKIFNGFNNNQIFSPFDTNSIFYSFANNIIQSGSFEGNLINADNFNSNTISAYFVKNNLNTRFQSNTIYSPNRYFTKNNFNGEVSSYNFTQYFGNVASFSYNFPNGSDGSYPNLPVYIGSTDGKNAAFNVEVSAGAVSSVTISNAGIAYLGGETLRISGSLFGGVDGTGDLEILIETVSEIPVVLKSYTAEIYQRSDGTSRLSYMSTGSGAQDVMITVNPNEPEGSI